LLLLFLTWRLLNLLLTLALFLLGFLLVVLLLPPYRLLFLARALFDLLLLLALALLLLSLLLRTLLLPPHLLLFLTRPLFDLFLLCVRFRTVSLDSSRAFLYLFLAAHLFFLGRGSLYASTLGIYV